jgi:hypothetical protein
VTKYSAFKN